MNNTFNNWLFKVWGVSPLGVTRAQQEDKNVTKKLQQNLLSNFTKSKACLFLQPPEALL